MVTLAVLGGRRGGSITVVHACGCSREGPYLLLPTGTWHAKICSCSMIVSRFEEKRDNIGFYKTLHLAQKVAPNVCSQVVE